MVAIGIKELKARAGELVKRTEAGERILVTKRGRPVAAIVPLQNAEAFYDQVLQAIIGPSLRAAEKDLAAGRVVSLEELSGGRRRRRSGRDGRKAVGRKPR